MPDGGGDAEAALEAFQPLGGEGDLRQQDQGLAALAEAFGDCFQVDLGLAGAGDAVEQGDGELARGDGGEQAQPTDMTLALEELRSDAERNGHTATVSFHGLPVVTVKPASFKRCLGNLVSNAARHANAISISGQRDHRYLTVTIDDDGPGIPPDMREEVFKPFLRLDDARNQDEGGTGLGLAIARDIARSHGGDITLGDSPMGGLRAAVRVPV